MNKEITIFTEGNSNNMQTWSNVPYFFTKGLENKGYIIHRINVSGNKLIRGIYNKIFRPFILRFINPETTFYYNRSFLYSLETNLRMKHAVKAFPQSSCFISTSFSFSPIKYTNYPCVLFCDWTYDYYFTHFLKRQPDLLEKKEVTRQNNILEKSDYVFVLFPDVTNYMKKKYINKNIFYLGNVINSDLKQNSLNTSNLAPYIEKQKKCNILFIGIAKYIAGAKSLIQAALLLRNEYPALSVDIIGMEISDFGNFNCPDFVKCHGYLDKNIVAQKTLYDSILANATVYVNTTPFWAGFSSAIEALSHSIPVITTAYNSFTETFGTSINFGYYCHSNLPSDIVPLLKELFNLPPNHYELICQNAFNAVKGFTWDVYIDKMLTHIGI